MDPRRLRREHGRDLVLDGGIDKRELTAIETELQEKIPPLLAAGGYVPHVDHSVPPDIPYYNFMYYLELKLRLTGRDG